MFHLPIRGNIRVHKPEIPRKKTHWIVFNIEIIERKKKSWEDSPSPVRDCRVVGSQSVSTPSPLPRLRCHALVAQRSLVLNHEISMVFNGWSWLIMADFHGWLWLIMVDDQINKHQASLIIQWHSMVNDSTMKRFMVKLCRSTPMIYPAVMVGGWTFYL
jgi:hypothetical protein